MRRAIPAATLILLLASCGGEHADAPPAAEAAPAPTTTSAAPAAAPASASSLGSIAEKNGAVTISYMENGEVRELYGDPRTTGKRKYTVGDGPVLYEIKPGDDGGFKLRNPDGTLRWKVKVSPDKIKISNNEQNDNPFELKVKDASRVKVVGPGERELGNVRYAGGKISVDDASGRVIFSTTTPKASGAYGVLLCNTIPERERYILAAEILSRGR
jgi:hypothetical protein